MFGLLRGARGLVAGVNRPFQSVLPTRGSGPFSVLTTPLMQRSMKVMSALQKRCENCYMVRRGNIQYVYCKVHPRHKARQGPKRRKK